MIAPDDDGQIVRGALVDIIWNLEHRGLIRAVHEDAVGHFDQAFEPVSLLHAMACLYENSE